MRDAIRTVMDGRQVMKWTFVYAF